MYNNHLYVCLVQSLVSNLFPCLHIIWLSVIILKLLFELNTNIRKVWLTCLYSNIVLTVSMCLHQMRIATHKNVSSEMLNPKIFKNTKHLFLKPSDVKKIKLHFTNCMRPLANHKDLQEK